MSTSGQELQATLASERNGSSRGSDYSKLRALFKKNAGANHLILLQGTPDPDAISSAMALQHLAGLFEIESTILCFAGVSHHENRTLVKRLGINLVKYTGEMELDKYSMYSIVDSQKTQTPIDRRLKEHAISLFAFIDHHREETNPPPAAFVDIRPMFGSTAAILCEYLQEEYPDGMTPTDPEHVRLATAMMHGLRTDTSRFLLATQADYAGAAFLAPCVDSQVIEVIERRVLTPAMLDMFERALVNRRTHDNFIVSDVGFVRSSDRDGIPQVTELLLAREGTDTVLVFGIVDEQTIDGSLRTRSETINPDEFLKGVLGSSPESGRYYGGGNIRDRGGFQIPLGFFGLCEDKEQIYAMTRLIIERAFLGHIGRDHAASAKKSQNSAEQER